MNKIHVLHRWGGLGDVLMAMAAAKALKILQRSTVILVTQPGYHDLARCCPYLDAVIASAEDLQTLAETKAMRERHGAEDWKYAEVVSLNPIRFGLDQKHQVDAYLEQLGIEAPPILKSLRLDPPMDAVVECEEVIGPVDPEADHRRILLHPGRGDLNRTWYKGAWQTLALRLLDAGWLPVIIGEARADPHRGVHRFELPLVQDLVNRFAPLPLLVLMQRSALLVSTDSGPIQVAGACEIPIVGIYSVVSGANRLPYRQGFAAWRAQAIEPECVHAPCYAKASEPGRWEREAARMQLEPKNAAEILPRWCLSERPYHCMEGDLADADRVFQACLSLLK